MNIGLITSVPLNPPWDQGDKNLAYALTQAMCEHHFQIFTIGRGRLPEGENLNYLPLYKSRNPSILQKARIYWHLLGYISERSNGRAHIINGKPELYHLVYRPTPLSSHLSRLIPEFQHKPTVHTVPSVVTPSELSPDLFFARRLVAISRFAYRTLNNMGLDNVAYIPPGIDVGSWVGLASRRNRMKFKLGLAGKPVLLYPGHYAPGYGIDLILHALPIIAADFPDVKILFACRLRSHKDLLGERAFHKEITELGLGRNVCFFNTVNDMRLLIGASDLTLLPLETMQNKVDIPITLLESLAAGVPVIVSDLAPMNELFHSTSKEEETIGRIIPPGDAKAIAYAVIDLLKDKQLRDQLAKNGQVQVQIEYNLRHAACEYNRIYQELQSCQS